MPGTARALQSLLQQAGPGTSAEPPPPPQPPLNPRPAELGPVTSDLMTKGDSGHLTVKLNQLQDEESGIPRVIK